jgi:hypothetical protein
MEKKKDLRSKILKKEKRTKAKEENYREKK